MEPAAFRERYAIPSSIRIYGPYTGNLSNSGERIRLRKPDGPNLVDGLWVVPYIDVDSVTYADRAPWPSQPDGYGPSLERISPTAYADDPINWRPSRHNGGTPGTVHEETAILSYQSWLTDYNLTGDAAALSADLDGDGVANLLEYAFGMDPTVSSLIGLPMLGQVSDEGAQYLTLIFHRQIGATDLHYTPEFGPSLHSWSEEAAVEIGSPSPSGNNITEMVTVRDTVPIDASSRRFGRVRVHLE